MKHPRVARLITAGDAETLNLAGSTRLVTPMLLRTDGICPSGSECHPAINRTHRIDTPTAFLSKTLLDDPLIVAAAYGAQSANLQEIDMTALKKSGARWHGLSTATVAGAVVLIATSAWKNAREPAVLLSADLLQKHDNGNAHVM